MSNGYLNVSHSRPCRALVVDDNEINRKILDIMLTEAGADVRHAVDGQEACVAYARESFDVVLMDIQMPVMDGHMAVQVIRALEAEDARPRTPIIMVSAHCGMKDIDHSIAVGADMHLGKPVQVSSLLSAVRDALNGWPGRREGALAFYYP